MLVHLYALGHLDPLFLRRALAIVLFIDGLEVLDLLLASLDALVAGL